MPPIKHTGPVVSLAGRTVTVNEPFKLVTSASVILPAAVVPILQLLPCYVSADDFMEHVGLLDEAPNQPRLSKRLSKYLYKHHGKSLSNDVLTKIGNIMNDYRLPPVNFVCEIAEYADWERGYYGDAESCFFSTNVNTTKRNARAHIQASGGYPLKIHDPDGSPVGRAFILPINDDSFMVFNCYNIYQRGYTRDERATASKGGLTTAKLAMYLSLWADKPVKRYSMTGARSVETNSALDQMWYNNDTSYVVGVPLSAGQVIARHNLIVAVRDGGTLSTRLATATLCACGRAKTGSARKCDTCKRGQQYACDGCGVVLPMSQMRESDGSYFCSACVARMKFHHITGSLLVTYKQVEGLYFHPDDIVDVVEKPTYEEGTVRLWHFEGVFYSRDKEQYVACFDGLYEKRAKVVSFVTFFARPQDTSAALASRRDFSMPNYVEFVNATRAHVRGAFALPPIDDELWGRNA